MRPVPEGLTISPTMMCESFRNACVAECSPTAGQFGNPANRRDDDAKAKQVTETCGDRHRSERRYRKRTERIGLISTEKVGPFLEKSSRALCAACVAVTLPTHADFWS